MNIKHVKIRVLRAVQPWRARPNPAVDLRLSVAQFNELARSRPGHVRPGVIANAVSPQISERREASFRMKVDYIMYIQ